ncbi:NUC189-domain-containing protein [Aulographum hederae CBS 113979]|uniref:NUC189-domain-containing protein n=1 Tax=Aulographum hederae CBS 113979 TaxID=1176131 RepID=A0A6G1H735_9PEZI|nr:NUC189-domain-containing protein [Aulographum hederae CBS 113979]
MPAQVSARRRQAQPLDENIDVPPTKRQRHSHDTVPNSIESALIQDNGRKLTANLTNGASNTKRHDVDESHAVVNKPVGNRDVDMADAGVVDVIEVSSAEDESDDEDSEEDKESEPSQEKDEAMENGGEPGTQEIREEPSFGDILKQRDSPVDVEAEFVQSEGRDTELAKSEGPRALSAPSATSLGIVLAQALRTNDRDLLEKCFDMNDLDSVRATIERLPSSLVGELVLKLADRLHKRPGRAGNLMVWVQWAIVSHGGYIANQRGITKKLAALNKVMRERANGLQPLLALKGKLDMLAAQLDMRQSMQSRRFGGEDDEEEVIYVEGQESDLEDQAAAGAEKEDDGQPDTSRPSLSSQLKKQVQGLDLDEEEEESDDDEGDMPITFKDNDNDVPVDATSEASDDSANLIDDEASEASDDDDDEASSDDQFDAMEDESGDERPKKKGKARK